MAKRFLVLLLLVLSIAVAVPPVLEARPPPVLIVVVIVFVAGVAAVVIGGFWAWLVIAANSHVLNAVVHAVDKPPPGARFSYDQDLNIKTSKNNDVDSNCKRTTSITGLLY